MNIQKALMSFGRFITGHRTQILTISAMSGVAATAFVAFSEGPEIKKIIEEKLNDLELTPEDDAETRKVIKREMVRKVAPRVAKIILIAAITMRSIHELNVEHRMDYASAAALAALNQKKLDDMCTTTEEVVGKKRFDQIQEKIVEKQLQEEPRVTKADTFDGQGFLVYDPQSGFQFHVKNPVDLDSARVELQDDLNNSVPWISVNDYYSRVLDQFVHIRFCDRWGWNMGQKMDVHYKLGGNLEGHPCYVLTYNPDVQRKPSGEAIPDDDIY